jgi:hypothetical protein
MANFHVPDPVLTRKNVAVELGVGIATVDRIPDEELPRVQLSKRRLGFRRSDVSRYLESHVRRPADGVAPEAAVAIVAVANADRDTLAEPPPLHPLASTANPVGPPDTREQAPQPAASLRNSADPPDSGRR